MNIPRYKWPVIVAAGLHGALFIGFPQARIVKELKALPAPLLDFPPEVIQVQDPEMVANTETNPTTSSPALPALVEPPPLLTDKPVVTVPLRENAALRPIDPGLKIRPESNGGPFGPGEITLGTIARPTDLDRVPRATAQMPPDYPSDLRRTSVTGSVTVEFDVDPSGRVIRASAVRFTHREFVDPAVRAVLRWHFEPGKRNGRAVPFRMMIPIEFGLAEN